MTAMRLARIFSSSLITNTCRKPHPSLIHSDQCFEFGTRQASGISSEVSQARQAVIRGPSTRLQPCTASQPMQCTASPVSVMHHHPCLCCPSDIRHGADCSSSFSRTCHHASCSALDLAQATDHRISQLGRSKARPAHIVEVVSHRLGQGQAGFKEASHSHARLHGRFYSLQGLPEL